MQELIGPFTIHTDGGCNPNPGPGGWGVVLDHAGGRLTFCGGLRDTTNNRMELMAAIKALEMLPPGATVALHTDSEYVKKGITVWISAWKRNGWRTRNNGPVANQQLWRLLDELCQRHRIKWHWVKGHNGHPENELADELAGKGRAQALVKE